MKFHSKHGQAQILDRSTCELIGDRQVTFLDSEVNGAVFMAQRSWGSIPLDGQRADDQNLIETVKRLDRICTFGGFIVAFLFPRPPMI